MRPEHKAGTEVRKPDGGEVEARRERVERIRAHPSSPLHSIPASDLGASLRFCPVRAPHTYRRYATITTPAEPPPNCHPQDLSRAEATTNHACSGLPSSLILQSIDAAPPSQLNCTDTVVDHGNRFTVSTSRHSLPTEESWRVRVASRAVDRYLASGQAWKRRYATVLCCSGTTSCLIEGAFVGCSHDAHGGT